MNIVAAFGVVNAGVEGLPGAGVVGQPGGIFLFSLSFPFISEHFGVLGVLNAEGAEISQRAWRLCFGCPRIYLG